jgi:hypothetical protein
MDPNIILAFDKPSRTTDDIPGGGNNPQSAFLNALNIKRPGSSKIASSDRIVNPHGEVKRPVKYTLDDNGKIVELDGVFKHSVELPPEVPQYQRPPKVEAPI